MVNRKQVAEKAGVSVATVSRALNGSGYVSKHNREVILKVVNELSYQPNPVAVSLKKNKTHQLLFYVRDLSNYYYMEMYKGMLDYACKNGYMIIISGNFNYDQIGSLMVDGVLLPTEFFSDAKFTGRLHVPTIVASYGKRVADAIHHVDVDTTTAMKIAVEYLRSMGHTKIAYASLDKNTQDEPRHLAYRALLSPLLGVETDRYILGPAHFDESTEEINYFENGITTAEQFIESGIDATAIVCFNDDTAIGFISCLQSRGRKVPEDISVVGIDGHFGGKYTSPPLTTVSISPHAHGMECARVLIELVEGRTNVEPVPVEIKLIERESVRKI